MDAVGPDGRPSAWSPSDPGLDAAGRRHRQGGAGGADAGRWCPTPTFTSYYGRPILKPPPWEADIPAYLFTGGLAAGSSLLAAGADLTGRPALRRAGRLTAAAGVAARLVRLVNDLGRPERFHHMLRVVKPTSPMSVGTWILTAVRSGRRCRRGCAEVAGCCLSAPVRAR